MHKYRILIVCPEPQGLALLTSMLKSLGHLIEEAPTDRVAVRLMERNPINMVLASVDPGDPEALELLTYVRRKHTEVPVILMFPRLHPERAKEALRLGAMAVLKYPVPAAELRAAVLQALEQCEAQPIEATPPPSSPHFTPPPARSNRRTWGNPGRSTWSCSTGPRISRRTRPSCQAPGCSQQPLCPPQSHHAQRGLRLRTSNPPRESWTSLPPIRV